MKFVRTGELRLDALERIIERNPLEGALTSPLKRLDYLLRFIEEKKPDILLEYISNLTAKYRGMVKEDYVGDRFGELEPSISEFIHLKEYPELVRSIMDYMLQVLHLPEDADWIGSTLEVTNGNNLRMFLHPRYYNVLTLTETLPRDDAIELYKRYITHFLIDTRDPDRERYDNLETLHEKRTRPTDEPSDWVIVRGMMADGKHAYRNDNCLWVDALEDLSDSELKYYICCYGDYEGARNIHESVVLTMGHTIAQGDPYCSRVLHDTRVDWDLRHPPKDFWDNMEG